MERESERDSDGKREREREMEGVVGEEREIRKRRGSCDSEWTALHWQDKIRIDSLVTASLSKQQRERKRERGGGGFGE